MQFSQNIDGLRIYLDHGFSINQEKSDAMAIVTISHEIGAGGPEIGQLLADRLGYRYVDHELISLVLLSSLVSGLWSLVSGLWSLVSGLWSLVCC